MQRIITIIVAALVGAGIAWGVGKSSTPAELNTAKGSFAGGADGSVTAEGIVSPVGDIFDDAPVVVVNEGESIQAAVAAAEEGTIIRVMPGRYHETVYIDKHSIKLSGVIIRGERPVLDGEKTLNDAILYSGNNIVIENFDIRDYKGNAIMGQAGNNFEIRDNIIIDTGVYGIFPQLGQNGLVVGNVISGIEDAAIYVGMSDNIHVAGNEVFDSVAGIEIENSRHAIVENNYVHNNTGGLLAFITPGLPIKTTYDVIFRNNFVVDNNTPNFGAPGSTVAGVPAGTGLLIMAADQVKVEGNIFRNNKTAAIIITDHNNAPNTTLDPGADPAADEVAILDNVMINNGYDTIDEVKALMLLEMKTANPDIVRVGVSRNSCIYNEQAYNTVGLGDFAACDFDTTSAVSTYLLDEPVPPIELTDHNKGMYTYLGICTGCHTYTGRMIGPPVQVIQALYMDDPEGLAAYIANPVKKREDYPEMPPQNYLSEETRLAVAKYMLEVTN